MKYPETCIAVSKFQLLFQPLQAAKALSFPCNAQGQVPMDELSEQARENYLFARAVIGHEYARPVIEACDCEARSMASPGRPKNALTDQRR